MTAASISNPGGFDIPTHTTFDDPINIDLAFSTHFPELEIVSSTDSSTADFGHLYSLAPALLQDFLCLLFLLIETNICAITTCIH